MTLRAAIRAIFGLLLILAASCTSGKLNPATMVPTKANITKAFQKGSAAECDTSPSQKLTKIAYAKPGEHDYSDYPFSDMFIAELGHNGRGYAGDENPIPLHLQGRAPNLNPSQDTIVYIDRNGDLATVAADGSNNQSILQINGGYLKTPVWSPSGDYIVFAMSYSVKSNQPVLTDLYRVEPDGSHLTRLTDASGVITTSRLPSPGFMFLPDDEHIVYGLHISKPAPVYHEFYLEVISVKQPFQPVRLKTGLTNVGLVGVTGSGKISYDSPVAFKQPPCRDCAKYGICVGCAEFVIAPSAEANPVLCKIQD